MRGTIPMFDVAIIGAGPAGATLARLIGERFSVLLIEKRALADGEPGPFPTKCCGGLLAPDAQEMLGRLGLGLPQELLTDPQLFVIRVIDIPSGLERYYQRFYLNIDRERFDRWLVSLVSGRVDVRCSAEFKSFERGKEYATVRFTHEGRNCSEKAKLIIGADGASSRVRAGVSGAARAVRRYIAVQEWLPVKKTPPYFSIIFDPDITDFYAWTIPKKDMLLVGAALEPKRETSARFAALKEKLRAHGYRFGEPVRREGVPLVRPAAPGQTCTGEAGVGLIGEAAGWISPSSGEGLSYALKSALLAARALQDGLEGFHRDYFLKTRSLRRNIRLKNLKSCVLYNPLLRALVMRTGIRSIDVVR